MSWAALGSFAGNLLGDLVSHGSDREPARSRKLQWHLANNQIQMRVEDAKKAGIHPLAALGISPQGFSPSYVGGKDYAKMGQDLGGMLGRALDPRTRKLAKIRELEAVEDLKRKKLENIGLRKNIESTSVVPRNKDRDPITVGLNDQANAGAGNQNNQMISGQDGHIQMKPSQINYQGPPGLKAGIQPLEGGFIDSELRWWPVLDQESSEGMESSHFNKWKYDFLKAKKHLSSIWHAAGVNSEAARKSRNVLRRSRPKSIWKGWEWRYNLSYGGFVLRKIGRGNNNSRFYDWNEFRHIPNSYEPKNPHKYQWRERIK